MFCHFFGSGSRGLHNRCLAAENDRSCGRVFHLQKVIRQRAVERIERKYLELQSLCAYAGVRGIEMIGHYLERESSPCGRDGMVQVQLMIAGRSDLFMVEDSVHVHQACQILHSMERRAGRP